MGAVDLHNQLTRQEKLIVENLADGDYPQEIADELHISYRTVINHIQNIYEKVDTKRSLHSLVAWYYKQGKATIASFLLLIAMPNELLNDEHSLRQFKSRRITNDQKGRVSPQKRRHEHDSYFDDYIT